MAIGYNYVAPYFRRIEFNPRDVHDASPGAVVVVPNRHKVLGQYEYEQLSLNDRIKVASMAPNGTEMMYVLNI